MRDHVIMTGFMGAGKTTVGKALAKKENIPFLDTDQLIEQKAGMTISRIFEVQGEEAFRNMETAVLEELQNRTERSVISVGGGLPLREENRELLWKLGTVVYLKVQPETVLERLKGDRTRPMLQGGEAKERVTTLLAYRTPLYQKAANLVVEADDKRVGEIADEIMEKLKEGEQTR